MQTDEYAKMRALEDHYWWFVSRRKMALALLKRFAPDSKSVLDLGCGTGAMMGELELDRRAVGIDFSEHAVAFCKERGLRDIVHGNAESLPFTDACFDAVVSLDTLEHVPNDVKAVAEAARALKSGGVLVMNVPAFRWLWGPHDVALMHQRRYTVGDVKRLLESAGLQVELVSYSVFFLFPIVVVIRALDKTKTGPPRVKLPSVPGPINRALAILQDAEARLLMTIRLPWGSSVVAVARKKD